jgi:hypothetical protein
MSKQTDMSSRFSLAKKIAESAMQERTGNTSSIQEELEAIQAMVDEELESYLDKSTPPPDYLTTAMKEVWIRTLNDAPDHHFKKTEYQSLSEFCWTTVALQGLMAQDALMMEPEDIMKITRLMNVSRTLTLRLRLGTEKNSLKTKQAIQDKLARAEEMTQLLKDKTNNNPRAGLMFGEGSNEVQ